MTQYSVGNQTIFRRQLVQEVQTLLATYICKEESSDVFPEMEIEFAELVETKANRVGVEARFRSSHEPPLSESNCVIHVKFA